MKILKRCSAHFIYDCKDLVCIARAAYNEVNPGWAKPQASSGAPNISPVWRWRWDLAQHGINPDAWDRVQKGILVQPTLPVQPVPPSQPAASPVSAPPALVGAP